MRAAHLLRRCAVRGRWQEQRGGQDEMHQQGLPGRAKGVQRPNDVRDRLRPGGAWVCGCVCVCVYMYTYMYMYMLYIHTNEPLYTYMYMLYIHTNEPLYIHTNVCLYVYIYM